MIVKTKCKCCNAKYELIWDEVDMSEWDDDYDDGFEEDDDTSNDDPAYCPFCGTHIDYDE